MSAAPTTTPKRKRGVETSITPVAFNFDLSRAPEDGGDSPRSRVVHKFRGLALESSAFDEGHEESEDQARGGGGAEPGYAGLDGEYSYQDDLPASKRSRPDEMMQDADESNDDGGDAASAVGTEEIPRVPLPEVVADEPASEESQTLLPLPDGDGGLRRAYPSVNRLSDSMSRSSSKKTKKRAGTPPPPPARRKQEASSSDSDQEAAEEGMEIVEPIRAALTWREDEITIYDPEDEDDDGTGINGVGFKPTPALAHARVMKRRQQLAEYRKREESEARAKRSQRRRGGVGGAAGAHRSTPSPEQIQARRRVRFMDGDKLAFIATKS